MTKPTRASGPPAVRLGGGQPPPGQRAAGPALPPGTHPACRRVRGDWADFNLTCRAKIEPDLRTAGHLLRKAKAIQTEYDDRVGLCRTLLLEARLTPRPLVASLRRTAVLRLRDELPALAACPLLTRILDNWRDWARGSQPDEHGDRFWGL